MKKLKRLYYIFVAFATDFYEIKCIISLYLKKKQVKKYLQIKTKINKN